jgi:hypothetical protein
MAFRILGRYWKFIILIGILGGIFGGIGYFFSSLAIEGKAVASNGPVSTHLTPPIGAQIASWWRSMILKPLGFSSTPNVLEYLHQIKIQDLQTFGHTQAKIRINNQVYLPGAVINDVPYICFMGIEHGHMVFEDRQHQRYTYLIEEMLE